MSLRRCKTVRGEAHIRTAPPQITRVRNALLIPLGGERKGGLFDADGRLVRQAAYFRGLPEGHFPIEAEVCHPTAAATAPSGWRYYFAGHLTGHFGHFMFATLSRLWALPRPCPADVKLVLLNGGNAPDMFELEFAAAIYKVLGIGVDSFARIVEPTKFAEIDVPDPLLQENYEGHHGFAAFCHEVGEALCAGDPLQPVAQPLFLSKRLVRSGVHRLVDEAELCKALEGRGVDVVSPEQLPLSRQIGLWLERPVIGALSGSMLHTTIFASSRNYVALNPESWINSNQVILDRINGNRSLCLHPSDATLARSQTDGFDHDFALRDPAATARQLASILWARIEARPRWAPYERFTETLKRAVARSRQR